MDEESFSYRPRIVDSALKRKLRGKGAVLIEGPKWCGKTTTAEQVSKSTLSVDDPSTVNTNKILSEIDPERLLTGDHPRLLDEWQVAPKLWDAVRHHVDRHKGQGQFILTGSSVPADISETIHSGTGRFGWLVMRPMTLYESGDSTGDVSLASLFESQPISGCSNLDLDRLTFLICRGGWPESVDMDDDVALDQAFDYIDAVIRNDMSRVDNIRRDPQKVRMLLRSYARNQGTQISQASISADISSNDTEGVSEETVSEYLQALRKLYVIEDMKAWNPNLRSKTAIRTSDTRYFVDPSLAAASLRIGPQDLINDLNTTGFFFEALAVRDLRVYAESLDGDVYHYKDNLDNECDVVIHLRDGRYALLEVKLGGEKLIDEGVKTLKDVLRRIDTDKMGKPAFMAIITGTERYAYRRDDGIIILPLGALKN
ncbi:ATP-binding protein [Candidatus Methanarcanum hacksteinii]|uniref:ATP-binding protein n=1 Tax=Candidatus Methanarcanum hacksteinii TaxID=2911857 RepID=UPI0037DCBD7E